MTFPVDVAPPRGYALILEDDDFHADALVAAIARVEGLRPGPRTESLAALRKLLADVHREAPALVLIDLHLDDGSALDVVEEIAAHWPDARLLVVSSLTDERSVVEAFRRGAHGYVVKSSSIERLATAIGEVLAGHCPITPAIARHLVARLAPPPSPAPASRPSLSPRETELLTALGAGLSYAEVAEQFGVSMSTVQTHVRNVYRKLRATSKVEALNHARRHRLID